MPNTAETAAYWFARELGRLYHGLVARGVEPVPGVPVDEAPVATALNAIDQLRYERRLLGVACMTLDLIAAGGPDRWDRARREAEDVAQRIVDEIGHPVTDEPALGPTYRVQLAELRAELARVYDDHDQAVKDRDAARAALRQIAKQRGGLTHA